MHPQLIDSHQSIMVGRTKISNRQDPAENNPPIFDGELPAVELVKLGMVYQFASTRTIRVKKLLSFSLLHFRRSKLVLPGPGQANQVLSGGAKTNV